MQFSTRIVSFFVVLVALAAFALALPAKRASTADIQTILENLHAKMQPTLGEIKATVSNRTASFGTLRPSFQTLEQTVDISAALLDQLGLTGSVSVGSGPSEDELGSELVQIVTDFASALDGPDGTTGALVLDGLLSVVDGGLSQVLASVGGLFGGVPGLLESLPEDVAGLLAGLGMNLTLRMIGL